MVFLFGDRKALAITRAVRPMGLPNLADFIILLLIVDGVQEMGGPINSRHLEPVRLDLRRDPGYRICTPHAGPRRAWPQSGTVALG